MLFLCLRAGTSAGSYFLPQLQFGLLSPLLAFLRASASAGARTSSLLPTAMRMAWLNRTRP